MFQKERSKCDLFQSRLIQAPLPLDPVLGNNPRDPRVMLHNVAPAPVRTYKLLSI